MAIRRRFRIKLQARILTLVGGLLFAAFLSGCGSNGEVDKASTDQPPTPTPAGANGSTWDQMAWDQGKWK